MAKRIRVRTHRKKTRAEKVAQGGTAPRSKYALRRMRELGEVTS